MSFELASVYSSKCRLLMICFLYSCIQYFCFWTTSCNHKWHEEYRAVYWEDFCRRQTVVSVQVAKLWLWKHSLRFYCETYAQTYVFIKTNLNMNYLINYLSSTTLDTGERPYKCWYCSYATIQSSALKIHMRRHTGERPYICKYDNCGKKFAVLNTLVVHERTHTGYKPFMCPQKLV